VHPALGEVEVVRVPCGQVRDPVGGAGQRDRRVQSGRSDRVRGTVLGRGGAGGDHERQRQQGDGAPDGKRAERAH
jgi:hypothetical protein